jgi:hypothetical protein
MACRRNEQLTYKEMIDPKLENVDLSSVLKRRSTNLESKINALCTLRSSARFAVRERGGVGSSLHLRDAPRQAHSPFEPRKQEKVSRRS